jgi:hypothetical protein
LSLEVFEECSKVFKRELFKLLVSGNRAFQQLLQQLNLTDQATTQKTVFAPFDTPFRFTFFVPHLSRRLEGLTLDHGFTLKGLINNLLKLSEGNASSYAM